MEFLNLNIAKKLPNELQRIREFSIDESIEYICSQLFFENKIACKNFQDREYVQQSINYLKNKKLLKARADFLLDGAFQTITKALGNKDIIVFAWAGGRDTSALLATSLAFYPNKKYRLFTVLNGMSNEFENPRMQLRKLLNKFERPNNKIDIEHYYIDKISEIEKHTVQSAFIDKSKLGCPAFCSSCKMIIEKTIARASKQIGANNIMLGYAKYQGVQNWLEQTPEQIDFMRAILEHSGIKQYSPLYDLLEYPFDSELLLSSLGIPRVEHKLEMKCKGGGFNPKNIDKNKLIEFLISKHGDTEYVIEEPVSFISEIEIEKAEYYASLVSKVVELRENEEFRHGIFEELKYEGK